MEMINKFDISQVPQHKIVFAVTSEPDYSMDRVLLVEDYPHYGSYALVSGGHCSCYDFDETEWDAMILNDEELRKVLQRWEQSGMEAEKKLAALAMSYAKDWRM
jgi:hypothetical protein